MLRQKKDDMILDSITPEFLKNLNDKICRNFSHYRKCDERNYLNETFGDLKIGEFDAKHDVVKREDEDVS